MSPQELKVIQPVIKRIVDGYCPQKIFLFGSRAWGKPRKDSDFDLLLVKKGKKSFLKDASIVRKLINGQIMADILILNPEEMQERLAEGDLFLNEVVKKGKCLYETTK